MKYFLIAILFKVIETVLKDLTKKIDKKWGVK